MDLLHRKLSSVDDEIYFIASSIEEPYYFVRMRGVIKEITTGDEFITYRIQVVEILEPISVIRECITNKRFRIKSIGRKRQHYVDKYIRGYDIPDNELHMSLIKRLSKSYFDVSIMQTFETLDIMNSKLEFINKYNIDKLARRVNYLSMRNQSI